MCPSTQPLEVEVVELTRELIRLPSVLGNEGKVAERLRQEMVALGYDSVEVDATGNVIGIIQGERDGPTLLLDGHMDTVDVVPRSSWSMDPFQGLRRAGRIYGRGASDMKGALAAMTCACGSIDRKNLAGRVLVCGSVGEESIEGEALRGVIGRYRPDFVVIGESSDLRVARAGRGRAEFEIVTPGKPSHASTPHLGINAVTEMLRVVSRLEDLPLPSHPFVGAGVGCLTDIISAPYPAHSVVPSACRVTYERRLVPGETREQVLAEMEQAAAASGVEGVRIHLVEAACETYTGARLCSKKWLPPWELGEDHQLVQRALQAISSLGLKPVMSSYQFCTNAAYTAGEAGLPTIGFGPSREDLAHTVDEYVAIEQLTAAALGYAAICRSLLSGT